RRWSPSRTKTLSAMVAVEDARYTAPPFREALLPPKVDPLAANVVEPTVLVGDNPSDSDAIAPPLPFGARLFRNARSLTAVETATGEMANRLAGVFRLGIAPPSPFSVTLWTNRL